MFILGKVIKIIGKEKGPTSIILAGVHGDEKCGVKAFKKILPNLHIGKGQVFFMYGNPKAIKMNKRFTEVNLNRMFKKDDLLSKKDKRSYEYKRAQFLKRYFHKADVLLDLHESSNIKSEVFAICEKNAKKIAKYLPVKSVVSGFDKLQPGGTDYYMNRIGKIGICVECGYLGNPKSAMVAERVIKYFLKVQGHTKNNASPRNPLFIKIYSMYVTINNFTLSKPFYDFEKVLKGQPIGTDGPKTVRAKKDSVILFANNRKKSGEEAFLLGQKDLSY